MHLLPYLDQGPLYNKFKTNEPWDSRNNRPLVDNMPDVFRDEDDQPTSTTTRFVTMTGPETAFPVGPGLRIRDFRDGIATTILVLRVAPDRAVPWSKPDDAVFDPTAPLDCLGQLDVEGLTVLMVDGSIK